jgi:hypothetical protein
MELDEPLAQLIDKDVGSKSKLLVSSYGKRIS